MRSPKQEASTGIWEEKCIMEWILNTENTKTMDSKVDFVLRPATPQKEGQAPGPNCPTPHEYHFPKRVSVNTESLVVELCSYYKLLHYRGSDSALTLDLTINLNCKWSTYFLGSFRITGNMQVWFHHWLCNLRLGFISLPHTLQDSDGRAIKYKHALCQVFLALKLQLTSSLLSFRLILLFG